MILIVDLLLLIPFTMNVATDALPPEWDPYLWIALPVVALLGVPAVVVEVRNRRAVGGVADGDVPEADRAPFPADGRAWNIPAPTRLFGGRVQAMKDLVRAFTVGWSGGPLRVVALWGLAGVGKTQLALAYAARRRPKLEVGWLVPAADRVAAVAALAELAERLGVGDADQERACRRVVDLLAGRANWLLIFDSVLDPAVLADLLPTGPGQVLIVSTRPDWGDLARSLKVPPLSREDSIELLQAFRGRPSGQEPNSEEGESLAQVAEELGGLPLALRQAGAYAKATALTWTKLLERYHESRTEILTLARGVPVNYPAAVTVTWRLALRRVDRTCRPAGQLLRLLAHFAAAPIPRDLPLRQVTALPRALRRAAAGPLRLDEAVAVLLSSSLVTATDPDDDSPGSDLSVHQLVQAVVRDHIGADTSGITGPRSLLSQLPRASQRWGTHRWLEAAASVLLAATPEENHDARVWPRYAALLPHAQAVSARSDRLELLSPAIAALQHLYGEYLDRRRQDAAARQLLEQALRARTRLLGDDHLDTLKTMSLLGFVLHRDPGQLQRAHDLALQAVAAHQQRYGSGDLNAFMLMHNLAHTLGVLGEWKEARLVDEKVLRGRRLMLGEDHPDTLRVMSNLAYALCRLEEWEEARRLHEQTLERRRVVLGEDHPDTLRSMGNLADALGGLGRWEEARWLHEQTLERRRVVLGEDHPDTLRSMNNLDDMVRRMEAERDDPGGPTGEDG
ncbi:tetratricopeptide repeat protein [Planomonospora venezuelensis]|uniref:Tetratricopeptide (TPR) repeat protein n=1 Tax=Planomonospora venezuelensis TaxID=1999 RepID=A0A841DF46_PLAVE|nr:tetratricopeptide (TPR) repeat protein [Planomonospora venezuelensis]